jgi:hypothetical protein
MGFKLGKVDSDKNLNSDDVKNLFKYVYKTF